MLLAAMAGLYDRLTGTPGDGEDAEHGRRRAAELAGAQPLPLDRRVRQRRARHPGRHRARRTAPGRSSSPPAPATGPASPPHAIGSLPAREAVGPAGPHHRAARRRGRPGPGRRARRPGPGHRAGRRLHPPDPRQLRATTSMRSAPTRATVYETDLARAESVTARVWRRSLNHVTGGTRRPSRRRRPRRAVLPRTRRHPPPAPRRPTPSRTCRSWAISTHRAGQPGPGEPGRTTPSSPSTARRDQRAPRHPAPHPPGRRNPRHGHPLLHRSDRAARCQPLAARRRGLPAGRLLPARARRPPLMPEHLGAAPAAVGAAPEHSRYQASRMPASSTPPGRYSTGPWTSRRHRPGTRPPRHPDHPRQPGRLAGRGGAGGRGRRPVRRPARRPRSGCWDPTTPTPSPPAATWPTGWARRGRSRRPPPSSAHLLADQPAGAGTRPPRHPDHPRQPGPLAG